MSTQVNLLHCRSPRRGKGRGTLASALMPFAGPNEFIEHCFTDSRGEPVVQAPFHRELQEFLGVHAKALVELPRDHGKSFQICCRVLWELGKNPGLRVKIVCATNAVAVERSRFLRDTIALNAEVRAAFRHLRCGKPWAANAFTIQRDTHTIGPSVAAFGVGAGSTGTRADLLICDDIVDVRCLHSRAERDRVADYFTNNLMNLLEPDGRFWGLYTPWHADDINARLKKTSAYELFQRAIGPDFEPLWPEKWPTERLKARLSEIGTASFARGYRLVPIADDETAIRPAWVRFWSEPAEYDMLVLSVDPAVSTKSDADRTALVLLGRGTQPAAQPLPCMDGGRGGGACAVELRVLACTARRVNAPDLVNLIDAFDREWNPAIILFESNAAFEGMKQLLTQHTRFGAKLKGVTQSADKRSRIAAFSVAVENGAFRLKGDASGVDPSQRELFDEMTTFPFGEHDDLVDAAATGAAFLLDRREPRAW